MVIYVGFDGTFAFINGEDTPGEARKYSLLLPSYGITFYGASSDGFFWWNAKNETYNVNHLIV